MINNYCIMQCIDKQFMHYMWGMCLGLYLSSPPYLSTLQLPIAQAQEQRSLSEVKSTWQLVSPLLAVHVLPPTLTCTHAHLTGL